MTMFLYKVDCDHEATKWFLYLNPARVHRQELLEKGAGSYTTCVIDKVTFKHFATRAEIAAAILNSTHNLTPYVEKIERVFPKPKT